MKMSILSLCTLIFIIGCAKDKNMEDFRREQLQENLARISAVSGTYTGSVISEIDNKNLGAIILKFQARTDIQSSSSNVANQQTATVSGSINFQGVNSAEIVFENGVYDDVSGDFKVTIPTAQLSLTGVVSGGKWVGTIEAKGHPEFGGFMTLQKNAPLPNSSSIQIGGSRLQQIKKMSYAFVGSYAMDGISTPFKMSFVNRDNSPEQNLFELFSPVRNVNINCDFTDFELYFTKAILDDKAGTLIGREPVDQRGMPAKANLKCVKFDETTNGDFGWDCEIQTKTTTLNLHLSAKR